MYDPECAPTLGITKEQYMNQKNSPTINHFHEKLLLLKDMMKTKGGKEMAIQRHAFMEAFLTEFDQERNGIF